MKRIITLAALALLLPLAAIAQNVTFILNLTNLPPDVQVKFAEVYSLHQAACVTNVNRESHLPGYIYVTNRVDITDAEGNVIGQTNVVRVANERMPRSAFFSRLFTDTYWGRQRVVEAARDALEEKKRQITEARNKDQKFNEP